MLKPADRRSMPRGWRWALLVCAGAVLLRVPGLSADLWLDEVWSLDNALKAAHWWDLVLGTRIDNNHHLNSLYLYVAGPGQPAAVYRLLAFVSGIGVVATAWVLGARDSARTALLAALLFGGSYLFAFYASEARGYSTAVWLTLLAWYCVERYAESPRRAWAAAFALCSLLGVMAHQTFVMFLAGAYVWFDAHLHRTRPGLRDAIRATGRLFAVPVVLVGGFYALVLFRQEIGGGPPYRLAVVAAQTLSAVSGGPLEGVGLWVAAALVGGVFVAAIESARRAGDDRWQLYVATGLVIPALLVIARQPTTLSPRYFIVPASVLLLATARWLSAAIARGGAARAGAVALVAVHVAGAAIHTTGAAVSRGQYRAALAHIVERSSVATITVASAAFYGGHEFRNRLLIEHYRQALGVADRLRYVAAADYPAAGADWVIVESLGEPPQPSVFDPPGHRYAFEASYPAGDLSGTTWHLYRRSPDGRDQGGRIPDPRSRIPIPTPTPTGSGIRDQGNANT